MKLDRVTITGADDSVEPADLLALSRMYPFAEWGILASESRMSSPRYPSREWIFKLQQMLAQGIKVPLSLHLCGRWTRELLLGAFAAPYHLFQGFDRVQLNFNVNTTLCDAEACFKALQSTPLGDRQFIFQLKGQRYHPCMDALFRLGKIDLVPLFDASGGAGITPAEWPQPGHMLNGEPLYHGYAGGLGPDNLAEQIPLIGKAAGDCRVWIDMETRVRSDNDRKFDLEKVRQCLEIAKPFVTAN